MSEQERLLTQSLSIGQMRSLRNYLKRSAQFDSVNKHGDLVFTFEKLVITLTNHRGGTKWVAVDLKR